MLDWNSSFAKVWPPTLDQNIETLTYSLKLVVAECSLQQVTELVIPVGGEVASVIAPDASYFVF